MECWSWGSGGVREGKGERLANCGNSENKSGEALEQIGMERWKKPISICWKVLNIRHGEEHVFLCFLFCQSLLNLSFYIDLLWTIPYVRGYGGVLRSQVDNDLYIVHSMTTKLFILFKLWCDWLVPNWFPSHTSILHPISGSSPRPRMFFCRFGDLHRNQAFSHRFRSTWTGEWGGNSLRHAPDRRMHVYTYVYAISNPMRNSTP